MLQLLIPKFCFASIHNFKKNHSFIAFTLFNCHFRNYWVHHFMHYDWWILATDPIIKKKNHLWHSKEVPCYVAHARNLTHAVITNIKTKNKTRTKNQKLSKTHAAERSSSCSFFCSYFRVTASNCSWVCCMRSVTFWSSLSAFFYKIETHR